MPEPRSSSTIPPLPVPRTAPPKTALGRWLYGGGSPGQAERGHTHPWYRVLWLTGVDYFSTLGYQPGIALLAAGALSPIATLFLVGMTLAGALPTYRRVAGYSYAGQGSIAMLENLLPGWAGKIMVLALLGFAGTDFVITMTLSAADAANHAIENPFVAPYVGHGQLALTLFFLFVLGLVFLRGFREAIGVASLVAIPYLILNLIVIGRGFVEIAFRPEVITNWRADLAVYGDWSRLALVAALVFPKLALGMSGFETGVAVMPVVQGSAGEDEDGETAPAGRISATRKLLTSAALIMSVMLILSSVVTTLLVPREAYAIGGPASGRAIAYLAHNLLGDVFGTVYDLSTILILWFAGASAMAGLLSLIPRYLPRFGMAPRWVAFRRPLVMVLVVIAFIVTIIFNASVEAQGAAYATGVLVLMLSAAVAVVLELWRERGRPRSIILCGFFVLVAVIFLFTLADNVVTRPDGVIIAGAFIFVVITASAFSRYLRSTELRVSEITFANPESAELWNGLIGKRVHLVPLRRASESARKRKTAELQEHYSIRGPMAFFHVNLVDNRSEFLSSLRLRIKREGHNYVITVDGAIAVANTIAYFSELIDPISIFLGLTRRNLMSQALRYFFWGEGETGLMVYAILLRYWEWTPEDDVRPLIFMMSE
ncbi:MAG TPA: hypothetical protein VFY29_17085 [Terriglobia bacterium]|nr:hypothetical protein [Terriglobia bacterium]